MFQRGPLFPPPPPYLHPLPPYLPFGPGLQPLHVFPLHGHGPLHPTIQMPFPAAQVAQPMVTPVQLHTYGGGSGGLLGGSGGGSVSAGPTYLIQELRHHNNPVSTKNVGSGSGHQSSEKVLLLKDFKDFKAYGTPVLKNKKVISQSSQTDSLKGLGTELLPPIVLNANTLAQLGLTGNLGGAGGLSGLSGSLTGGLGPGGSIQDTLLFKGGNAIW